MHPSFEFGGWRRLLVALTTAIPALVLSVPAAAVAADQRRHPAPGPAAATPAATRLAAGYQSTDLGTLGGTSSAAHAVNNHGKVVGEATTAAGKKRPFIWSHGRMRSLPVWPGSEGAALDINNRGEVAGYLTTSRGETHAVLWTRARIVDLGAAVSGNSRAFAINDKGTVLGSTAAGPVLWYRGETTPQTVGLSYAGDIDNEDGVLGFTVVTPNVYGHDVVRWNHGTTVPLGHFGGGFYGGVTYLNGSENGNVIGTHIQSHNASIITILRPGQVASRPRMCISAQGSAVNDLGHILAWCDRHYFVGTEDQVVDLAPDGVAVAGAVDINDSDWVAGTIRTADGAVHAAVFQPRQVMTQSSGG